MIQAHMNANHEQTHEQASLKKEKENSIWV